MTSHLWKYYLEDDLDNFRQLLAGAKYSAAAHSRGHGTRANLGPVIGSPGKALATSPTLRNKIAKSNKASTSVTLTRADINARDAHGVTLLHHIASSVEGASAFALILIQIPLLDLYFQDLESGWTALHRALYFGNITIARALMDRDSRDATEHSNINGNHNAGGLIKIKDREGNSPFDVFGASITNRILRHGVNQATIGGGNDDEEDEGLKGNIDDMEENSRSRLISPRICVDGDELFMFGSNKNLTLGFGDGDDRQFPERIVLKRPDHLLQRLSVEHQSLSRASLRSPALPEQEEPEILGRDDIPALVKFRPINILDVQLAKLHTAVLTTDPEANLFVCGFGPGGRLGTGDESTRFNFTCIFGGALLNKKIVNIGLGQNHTVAVSSHGEVYTWGNNGFGQLGYVLPNSNNRDDDPVQLLPRQIFGPLKREVILGAAASRIHSVVYSSNSLYTFGKNEGQLGLVDSDARSLELQIVPRKVAASLFSSSISMVSAIDKATVCLLENRDVWVFANYGWKKVTFPLDGFSNYFLKNSYSSTRYDGAPNHITKISSGGDTVCAMAKSGDVFTMTVSQSLDSSPATSSTTNPAKIRSALSTPQRIWSLRKSHMAVRDVDVGQDGSVIICTESGSVWKRVKRAKIKEASIALGTTDYKPKDYKFSRIPGLTRITAVRSNTFGAFAAARRDTDVLKTQVEVASNTLWKDVFPLLPFHKLSRQEDSDTEEPAPRFWTPRLASNDPTSIRHAILTAKNLEQEVDAIVNSHEDHETSTYDMKIGTTLSDIRIPCHEFILAGRSSTLRRLLQSFRHSYYSTIPDVLRIEYDKDGNILILFYELNLLTILNYILYAYTDSVIDVWHHTRHAPQLASTYRQVRTELMKIAGHLDMRRLEQAARVMVAPALTLNQDMELAIREREYFEHGDVEIELQGTGLKVHSALVCQRCPFFEGLFHGRAGGGWLSSRRGNLQEPQEAIKVDLKHVELNVFELVLRHIYADTGEELFDDVVTADLDAFLDLVMEVLAVANELMLDRLAQICQKLLGRFVNTRNVCQLLNAVAPCSVTEFKDAALEYICLNLEGMLENHLINELDDDLMLELDEVVRQNQLACLPFAKSGRAESELLERYPELAEILEKGKQVKIDSMAIKSRLHEDELKFSIAGKVKGKVDGDARRSPSDPLLLPDSSKSDLVEVRSPLLKSRTSAMDLMFDMDDDTETEVRDSASGKAFPSTRFGIDRGDYENHDSRAASSSLPNEEMWFDSRGKALSPPAKGLVPGSFTGLEASSPLAYGRENLGTPRTNENSKPEDVGSAGDKAPWRGATFSSSKLDMKDIMAQASEKTRSQLSSALSSRRVSEDLLKAGTGTKLSQKERKKQLQQQQLKDKPTPPPDFLSSGSTPLEEKPTSPWRTASTGTKVSLKDVLHSKKEKLTESPNDKGRTASNPSLTLRQTIPGTSVAAATISARQGNSHPMVTQRSISSPMTVARQMSTSPKQAARPSPRALPTPTSAGPSSSPTIAIKSIRHNPTPVEPSLQLSMADILSQQQTEKDIIKEAAAKRSLQEIQEEQAFQEWWDQEEAATRARLIEEEAAAKVPLGSNGRGGKSGRGGRGRGRAGLTRGRGRGGRGGREGHESAAAGSATANAKVGK
ncbi:hypothetical protein MMC11_007318 [Xylographa trunciseda]|nr:hypothetical protein [Xylographa trunciseda]